MERLIPSIHGDDHAVGGPDPIPSLAEWPIKIVNDATVVIVTSGDTAFVWGVPEDVDGCELVKVTAFVSTAGSANLVLGVLNRATTNEMLTSSVQIDAGDLDSKDSGSPMAVDPAEAVVTWGDQLEIHVDAAGGGAKGLGVHLYFLASVDAIGTFKGETGATGATGATGPQGEQGEQGPQGDPGGIVTWEGAWSSATTYQADDAVSHNGSSYVARTGSTDVEPGVDMGWETSWMLLADGAGGDLAAHLADTTDAHDASAISVLDSGAFYSASEVEGVLAEIAGLLASAGGGAEDPVFDIFGDPDTAFEFDTSSLTGLTTFGTPDILDADTTIPGCLYIDDSASGENVCGVYASAPSAPWTAICKLADANVWTDSNAAGPFIGQATPGTMNIFAIQNNARQIFTSVWNSPTSFSALITSSPTLSLLEPPLYFAFRVNSSTDVDFLFSLGGRVWKKYVDSRNPSFTIGSIGISLNANAAGARFASAWDYLRIWESALTMPGAPA